MISSAFQIHVPRRRFLSVLAGSALA
ncbi:MAG: hypothetical protein RLZZ179_3243, partial [Verrucomicrobiota bacterium]